MDFASSYVYVAEEADDDVEMFDEAQLDNVSIKKQAKPRRKRDSDSDEADLPINEAKPSEPKKSKAEKPKDKKEKKVGFFGSIFGRSRKDAEEPAAAAPAPARELASDDDEDDDINDMEEQLQQAQTISSGSKVRTVRKATTNVVSLDLGALANDAHLFTGDITLCECGAAFSTVSEIGKDGGDEEREKERQVWKCEFCGSQRPVELEEDEIPKVDTVDYLLEPPKEKKEDDTTNVVFCIDISGSMCCTTEVPANLALRSKDKLNEIKTQFLDDHSDQYLPGQRRGATYVSRLESVQAAVDAQLEALKAQYPNRRATVVTFSNEVTVYDPVSKEAHVITGDKLNNYDYLVGAAEQIGAKLDKPVSECRKNLGEIVASLEERGATALGPALLVSIGLAGMTRGSSVVLCTDGLANIGVGNLEALAKGSDKDHDAIREFYENVGDVAVAKGVSVSIISIKGTQVTLEYLAKVALKTKGQNDIVDPLNMGGGFNAILKNPVVATDVSAKLIIHPGFRFHEEATSQMKIDVGNATQESTLTFEFELKSKDQLKNLLKGVSKLPFQVQIHFTKLNGAKCVRVISKAKEITKDRDVAEQHLNVAVMGMHSVQETAKLAQQGAYTKARMKQLATQKVAAKAMRANTDEASRVQYSKWKSQASELDTAIQNARTTERSRGLRYHSEEEDLSDSGDAMDDEDEDRPAKNVPVVSVRSSVSKKKKQSESSVARMSARSRNRTTDDDVSNVLYKAASAKKSDYY